MANEIVWISLSKNNKIWLVSNQPVYDIAVEKKYFESFNVVNGDLFYEDGKIVQKPREPDIVHKPTSLTMAQTRLALFHFGFLDQVISFINSIPGGEGIIARIHWDSQKNVQRNHFLVLAIQKQFGWTNEFIDEMFAYGFTQ